MHVDSPTFPAAFWSALPATLLHAVVDALHHLSAGRNLSGPQRFHGEWLPREGGAEVIAAIVADVDELVGPAEFIQAQDVTTTADVATDGAAVPEPTASPLSAPA